MKHVSITKKDPILMMMESSLLHLPTPSSISYLWNLGFLLGMTLVLQIITGLVLSMNFIPSTEEAFDSVIHIMRDIEAGWYMRYLHMNGASLFFALLYAHMCRGIYFNSPSKMPMVWSSGVVMLMAAMGAAFMGYVLPWGQMSLWGATVITSMMSAIPYIGSTLLQWLWGGFSVSQPTLNRFFSLHFLIPILIGGLALCHLIFLHVTGSSNPIGTNPNLDKSPFFPLYLFKDCLPMLMSLGFLSVLLSSSPNILGDVENFNKASITTTPPHIQPEWYFLFAYAILRSIPSKLGGVTAMAAALLIFLVLTIKPTNAPKKFSPIKKLMFWVFVVIVMLLTWIGANPVEDPFTGLGKTLTLVYFLMFSVL